MVEIEDALREVVNQVSKSNGQIQPSILTKVNKINQFAGEAISRSGEELADFIEKAGEEVTKMADEYRSESKDLAGKLREMYKDETARLNEFLVKIQELRDAMTEAQTKFLGAQ